MREGGYCCDSSGVRVVDRDHLILVAVVLNDTLDQYVERLAQVLKQNIVRYYSA